MMSKENHGLERYRVLRQTSRVFIQAPTDVFGDVGSIRESPNPSNIRRRVYREGNKGFYLWGRVGK